LNTPYIQILEDHIKINLGDVRFTATKGTEELIFDFVTINLSFDFSFVMNYNNGAFDVPVANANMDDVYIITKTKYTRSVE